MTSTQPRSHIAEEEKRVKASILDDKVKSRRGLRGRFNISDSVLLNFCARTIAASSSEVGRCFTLVASLVALFCSVIAV